MLSISYLKKSVRQWFERKPQEPAKLPILFVHLPKTAGTSFRKAASQSNKIMHVLCDYGKDNKTTSHVINQTFSSVSGKEARDSIISSHDDYLLTGHFTADKYKHLFYPYEISIFVRDPLQRVLSNYYHKIRNDQFAGDINSFLKTGHAKNLQLKHFGSLPLEYFGFIGLSERYSESIALLNNLYSLDLKVFETNTNPSKASDNYEVDDCIRKDICEINQKEIALYSKVNMLFQNRLNANPDYLPLYGSWTLNDELKISGRAYRAYSTAPINLMLLVKGKEIITTVADKYDPIPCDVKQPNEGYIGFDFETNDLDVDVSAADIEVLVVDTKERLLNLNQ